MRSGLASWRTYALHSRRKTWYVGRMRTILVLGLALTSLFEGGSTRELWSVTCSGNAGATAVTAYIYDTDGDMNDDWPFPVSPIQA